MRGWYACIAVLVWSGAANGCSAENPNPPPPAIEAVASEQPEITVTLDECVALTDRVKLTACLKRLKAQEDAELVKLETENAAKREELAQLEKEADAAMERLEGRILEKDPD